MASDAWRTCWQNCFGPEDPNCLSEAELLAINAMEDSLAPLDEQMIGLREWITRFEACYHEADREAEQIAAGIGAGRCPPPSNERPPGRKQELENARGVLSRWCENAAVSGTEGDIGARAAAELLAFIGEPTPLRRWQVARVVDRISHALDPAHPYHNLVLSVGDHGEPGGGVAGEPYRDHWTFLQQTRATLIHDTVEGRRSQVSLAYAIDLLMPCGWDFAGCLETILKAIGGDLHPDRPLACCARNIQLSPLCDRLRIIAHTLGGFGRGEMPDENTDPRILASLGAPTPAKRWLAASLDKTIRLHLTQPFTLDLF
jgi:hypothetical protein